MIGFSPSYRTFEGLNHLQQVSIHNNSLWQSNVAIENPAFSR